MNLKQFADVDSYYRDLYTGREIPWEEYMHRVIGKIGLNNIKPYIPFDLTYLKEKLRDDIHLNNTGLRVWDAATGFTSYINQTTRRLEYAQTHSGLTSLFLQNGITSFSVSDGVCVLKEAARLLVREMDND